MLDKIINDEKLHILQTYNRYKLFFARGEGAYLYDEEDNEYLDFLAGISVCNLGHCNKQINSTIKKQVDTLIHTSNLYYTQNQVELAKLISNISFKGKTFFANSGTEANEAAIKYMRLRGNKIAKDKNYIISLEGSFHGRSSGSLAITGQDKHKDGFEPILENIIHIKLNDIKALREHFNHKIAGIILEPIQGESGVYPLDKAFLQEAIVLSRKYNALLIYDEVQTGLGRTSYMLAYEHIGLEPDGFTLAKSLANGLPIGVFHIKDEENSPILKGKHASTFGGNPLVCKAAIEVIKILNDGLLDHVKKISATLFEKLYLLKDKFPIITEIRGRGLMIALEIPNHAQKLLSIAHKNKLLINAIGNDTIRLLPPLIISDQEVDLFYLKMKIALEKLL